MSIITPVYAAICNSALNDNCLSSTNPKLYINNVIQGIFSIFFIVGVVYFIWHFVFAGYHFIASEGDSKKFETAKNEMINAFLGLIAIFSVFAVLKLIGVVTGITGLASLQIAWPTL
jgi:Type IV secretion system pilin